MHGRSFQGPPLMVARILHVALAAAVLVYALVAAILTPTAAAIDGTVETALWVAALVAAVAGTRLYRAIPLPGDRTGALRAGPPSAPMPGASLVLPIASWALFEGVGLLGLVVRLLGGTTGWWLLGGSLLLLAVHPPRKDWFPTTGGDR